MLINFQYQISTQKQNPEKKKKKNEYRYVRNFTHQLSGYIDFSSTKISTDVCGPK